MYELVFSEYGLDCPKRRTPGDDDLDVLNRSLRTSCSAILNYPEEKGYNYEKGQEK